MTDQFDNKSDINPKIRSGIRKVTLIIDQKIIEKVEDLWQKLKVIRIIKSPDFIALKGSQFIKKVSRIYILKLREHTNQLFIGSKLIELQKAERKIQVNKVKDRVYEAKVKSLRVLSRQWKEKKSQNIYKNKYFTPKAQQTPKMVKQKVSQQLFITLRNILRGQYLQSFNQIKISEVIKLRNSKALYLTNYLLHKRRYWLISGLQKLKLNMLLSRQQKNRQEISQLDTKLVPVQDAQIEAIKQKQQKLEDALKAIENQKDAIEVQVEAEVKDIQNTLSLKKQERQNLKQRKSQLVHLLEQQRERSGSFEFGKEEIFYLIYKNFLINLKLWTSIQGKQKSNTDYLSKNLVLEWLQTPSIDFNLQKIAHGNQKTLKQQIVSLQVLIKQYERLHKEDKQVEMLQVYQSFFNGVNQSSNTFEQFFNKNKYSYRAMHQILKQNASIMYNMLENMNKCYETIKGEENILNH